MGKNGEPWYLSDRGKVLSKYGMGRNGEKYGKLGKVAGQMKFWLNSLSKLCANGDKWGKIGKIGKNSEEWGKMEKNGEDLNGEKLDVLRSKR